MTTLNQSTTTTEDFLDFLSASPSPFHAVDQAKKRLIAAGFIEIKEKDSWDSVLKPLGKYFYTRNQSAIVAFAIGGKYTPGNGIAIVGAHTDSPCLKIKPVSKREKVGYVQVGVELYGGGLWHTWFDRDLGLAGRVLVQKPDGRFEHRLVRIHRPIMRIPTLAIHLDRSANDGFTFNKEVQMTPVLALAASQTLNAQKSEKHPIALMQLLSDELKVDIEAISDFELCLYDVSNASLGGVNNEFVFSARLDNLCMSFCSLTALINSVKDANSTLAKDDCIRMVSLFDNEEVGSQTAHGADSNMMVTALTRIASTNFGSGSHHVSTVLFTAITHVELLMSLCLLGCC